MILAMRFTVKADPEQLPNRKLIQHCARFRTATGNTGDVYLADCYLSANDTSLRYAIPPGKFDDIKLNKLDDLWYSGTLNDTLDVIAEVAALLPDVDSKDEHKHLEGVADPQLEGGAHILINRR